MDEEVHGAEEPELRGCGAGRREDNDTAMPKRLEIIWDLTQRILAPGEEPEDEAFEEGLGLIERVLSSLELGLMDPGDPYSLAFVKALLNDLNPAFACSLETLSDSNRERLQSVRMRALRLGLRQRKGQEAANPQSLDDVENPMAQAS